MSIVLKSRREIEQMRRAGQLGCDILAKMKASARAGITTWELDELARRLRGRERHLADPRQHNPAARTLGRATRDRAGRYAGVDP